MTSEINSELDYYQNYLRTELYAKVKEDSLIFEFIQSGVLDGIWYWDLTKPENEWMSPKFWETFGINSHEKQHHPSEWQDIIFEEDLEVANRNFNKHLEKPNHPYDQIVRYRHSDGSTVWVRCRGLAIHDAHGTPIRMIGAHTNITPIMKKQEELVKQKLSNSQLESIISKTQRDLASEKMLADSLKQKLELITQIDESSGLWFPKQFTQEIRKLYSLSKRLQVPFNLAAVFFNNIESIRKTYGTHEVNNKLSELNIRISRLDEEFVLTQFDNDVILICQIGYQTDDFAVKMESLEKNLVASSWSIVKPDIHILSNSSIPSTTPVKTDFDEEFENFFEKKYTELIQKSL